ncbi:preprotein translocase subunit SecG [Rhizobium sp. C1]|uniref:preprotein translocase subunit SecG n=1 Tax=Rhizobium sp. C1 TaxID=1349799 RepID=UPI001E315F53|nr:preprotein translocase subunit SecG [Rhizobium sp. C1]MCD2177004.1 preprotein translocase subunit SecG [Rhizobium sp. C1]
MQTVLIVIHLMIVLALVGIVLIQRSEGGGLGIGGGSGFMSARGTANALTRTTAILATLFFITSLGLGILARYQAKPTDILDRIPITQQGQQNGILDQLGGTKPAETKPAVPDNGVPSAGAPAANAPAAQAPAAQTPAAPATGTAPAAQAPAATTPAAPQADPNKVPSAQ